MNAKKRHALQSSIRFVLVLAMLSPFVGCGKTSKSSSGGDPGTGKSKAEPSTKPIKIDAIQFAADWKGERDAAEKKYDNKTIEISGQMMDAGTTREKSLPRPIPYIRLAAEKLVAGKSPGDANGVYCNTKMKTPWKRVGPGGTVVLRGVVTPGGELENCELISATGTPFPSVTAVDLSRDFQKDPQAAKTKYHGHRLIVTGVIDKIGKNIGKYRYYRLRVLLKGEADRSVPVHCDIIGQSSFDGVSPKQSIQVKGKCDVKLDATGYKYGIIEAERL